MLWTSVALNELNELNEISRFTDGGSYSIVVSSYGPQAPEIGTQCLQRSAVWIFSNGNPTGCQSVITRLPRFPRTEIKIVKLLLAIFRKQAHPTLIPDCVLVDRILS